MNERVFAVPLVAFLLVAAIPTIAPAAQVPEQQELCGRSASLRADPNICSADENVAVIAPAATAADYLNAMKEARLRYETHFGAIPAPLVLVIGGEPGEAQLQRFRSDGILVLPWLSLAERLSGMEGEVRRQIGERLPTLTEAQRDAVVAQFLARIRPNVADGDRLAAPEAGIIQHEAAHQWFGRVFTTGAGQARADATPEYGSPAPDWLDETVAILAETDALTAQRRASMDVLIRQNRLPSLAALLAMRHPWTGRQGTEAGGNSAAAGAQVTVRVAVQAGETRSSDPSIQDFYVFCRAFADFLIEQSRDPLVVRAIALHLQGGGTFESWLSGQGLPGASTLAELEARWQQWQRRRAEAAAAAPAPA